MKVHDPEQQSPLHTVATLSCTAAGVVLIGELVHLSFTPDLVGYQKRAASAMNAFVPLPSLPEPMEQLEYAVLVPTGLVLLLVFATAFWMMFRANSPTHSRLSWIVHVPAWLFGSAVVTALVLVLEKCKYLYLLQTMFDRYPRIHLLVVVPLAIGAYHWGITRIWKRGYRIARVLILTVLSVVAMTDSLYTGNSLPPPYHFNPVVYPLAMLCNGAPIGGGALSLYGFYPVYIAPLVTLFGGGVTAVGLVFGVLIIVTIAALIHVVTLVIVNPFLRVCVAFTLAFSLYLIRVPHPEPYFQYYPIRMMFPALVLLALAWETRTRFHQREALGIAAGLAMTGVFWNIDSGLACVLSVLAFGFVRVSALWIRHGHSGWSAVRLAAKEVVLPSVVGAVVAAVLFLGAYYLQVRAWPEFFRAVAATRLLADVGYSFMPLPDGMATWQVVVLLAGACCLYGFRLFLGNREHLASFHVAVAVMTLAVLVYHIGRSHEMTLIGPLWIAPLAMAMIMDRLDESMRDAGTFDFGRVVHSLLLAYLVAAPVTFALDLDDYFRSAKAKLTAAWRDRGHPTDFEATARFIQRHSPGHSKVMIFAVNIDGVLYLLSQRQPAIAVSSSTDLLFRAEHRRILEFLRTNVEVPVFIGAGPTSTSPEIQVALRDLYRPAADGPSVTLLKRKVEK